MAPGLLKLSNGEKYPQYTHEPDPDPDAPSKSMGTDHDIYSREKTMNYSNRQVPVRTYVNHVSITGSS